MSAKKSYEGKQHETSWRAGFNDDEGGWTDEGGKFGVEASNSCVTRDGIYERLVIVSCVLMRCN